MRIKKLIIFLSGLFICMSFGQQAAKTFRLGERNCVLTTKGESNALASFISLHDDENTAVEAYLSLGDTLTDITLYELSQAGKRLLKYTINKKDYLFDPNRIFTASGIQKTLAKYNKQHPKQLHNKIKIFADSLLNHLKPASPDSYMVALHNNPDQGFSILFYQDLKDAIDLFIAPDNDIDDFFIVTVQSDFEYFKSLGFNVVLHSHYATDDGSLSVYCQRHSIPYINIEAQEGHKAEQMKMIEAAYLLLKSKLRTADSMESVDR